MDLLRTSIFTYELFRQVYKNVSGREHLIDEIIMYYRAVTYLQIALEKRSINELQLLGHIPLRPSLVLAAARFALPNLRSQFRQILYQRVQSILQILPGQSAALPLGPGNVVQFREQFDHFRRVRVQFDELLHALRVLFVVKQLQSVHHLNGMYFLFFLFFRGV